jgi:hypothetical protein
MCLVAYEDGVLQPILGHVAEHGPGYYAVDVESQPPWLNQLVALTGENIGPSSLKLLSDDPIVVDLCNLLTTGTYLVSFDYLVSFVQGCRRSRRHRR